MNQLFSTFIFLVAVQSNVASGFAVPWFEVVATSGPVNYMLPQMDRWQALTREKKTLPVGTLLETKANGVVELKFIDDAPSRRDKAVAQRIRIQNPMVTRLSIDLIKNYEFQEYPLKTLLAVTEKSVPAVRDKPELNIFDAIKRYMISLRNPDYIPELKEDPEIKDAVAGKRLQPIHVLSPVYDSLIYSQKKRSIIPIYWEKLPTDEVYLVSVWKEGESKGTPVGTTKDNMYFYETGTAGTYLLQVQNEKRSHISKVIRVSIEPGRFSNLEKIRKLDFLEASKIERVIPLEFPPNHLVWHTKKKTQTVQFSWAEEESTIFDTNFQLTVIDEVTRSLKYSKITKALSVNMELKPGRYSWFVKRLSPDGKELPKGLEPKSSTRKLVISNDRGFTDSSLKFLNQQRFLAQDKVFFLEF